MAGKKILSILGVTSTFLLSGMSEGNATILKCLHREDSSIIIRNPLFGMSTPQEDIQGNKHGYQSLDVAASFVKFESQEQPVQFRSWYRHAVECKNHEPKTALQSNKNSYQPFVDEVAPLLSSKSEGNADTFEYSNNEKYFQETRNPIYGIVVPTEALQSNKPSSQPLIDETKSLLSGTSEGSVDTFEDSKIEKDSQETRNPIDDRVASNKAIQSDEHDSTLLDDKATSKIVASDEQPEGQFREWYRHFLEGKNHLTKVAIHSNKRSYQPLVDKDIYAFQRKSEHSFRNWVYKLAQGKYAKKLDLLADSEYDLSTTELWGSTDSTLTSGRSEFTDIPHDPNELIDPSYNAAPVSPDYPRFLKFVRQGNSEIVSKKEMGLKALMDCPVQSEE